MGIEIEKKFLMASEEWRGLAPGIHYRQGYISSTQKHTVRVRTMGDKGVITIKGPAVDGVKPEFEYEIPLDDALEMLDTLCEQPLIEKTRHKIPHEGFIWEVDEFFGDNEGLVFAEIELEHVNQDFTIPEWIDKEVTGDRRYSNATLVRNPYSKW